jgi:NNP family nitrate/nitrite transporter-like MFS transporter
MPAPLGENIYYILFIALLLFMTFISRFIFAPLMPTIEGELDISHTEAGSFFLFISIGMLISQIFSGYISSKVNHRGALFISTLGLGIPLILLNFTNYLLAIKILLFVLGLAAGLHMPSAIATMTAMVDRKDWGKAFGLHGLAPALSLTIGPFVAILLLRILSWQAIITMIGISSIIVSLAFLRYCRCGEFPGAPPSMDIIKIVFITPSFWVMITLFALFLAGNIGVYSMLSLYLVEEAGFRSGLANSLLGLSRISGLFITFFSGMLVDRIGEKKHIVLVMITGGIATILIGTTSGAFLITMLFLQPAIIGCFPAAGFSSLARIVQPNLRSVTIGFSAPISYLIGGGLGPALIGYMGEMYSFRTGIIAVGCLIILSTALVAFLRLIDNLGDGC